MTVTTFIRGEVLLRPYGSFDWFFVRWQMVAMHYLFICLAMPCTNI